MFRNFGKKENYTEYKTFDHGKYCVCWDPQPMLVPDEDKSTEENIVYKESEDYLTWMQENFNFKPDIQEIKTMILTYFNDEIDKKILNGCIWSDGSINIQVYLSSENQFNYKAAYDLAYQTNGASLPFILKFGEMDNPQYYTFNTLEEFNNFYTHCINFINTTLQEGWVKKDSIDWSKYEN